MIRQLVFVMVLITLTASTCSAQQAERGAMPVSSLPISDSDLHTLESAHREREAREGRLYHPDVLTAADLHPDTPIMLAELDDDIPAFIVERQMVNQADTDMETDAETDQQTEQQATETDSEHTAESDETEMIESEFDVAQVGGGYGGGYGGGKKGKGKIVGYQKVPTNYKKIAVKAVPYPVKVPYAVPVKKSPPKKKMPPKKAPPKKPKKGGFDFGKKGGFGGYGGGFGGYGGGFGGHGGGGGGGGHGHH